MPPTSDLLPQPIRKAAGGRPPKFASPSRPVTLTLPDSTLEDLLSIHQDRSQAIVKLTQDALRRNDPAFPLVQLVKVGENKGVITVGSSKALQRIPFLHLVEIAPGRFLIALDPGNDFHSLEIAVLDLLDGIPTEDEREIQLMSLLLVEIRKQRKSERLSMAEMLFINMEEK